MLAGIHFQYITDKGEMMKKVLSSGKPFLAFIPPVLLDRNLKTEDGKDILERVYPEENYYPKWFVDVLKENKDNPNFIFGQEGYTHYCERCFEKFLKNGGREKDAFPDPFHEHVCLDGYEQSLEEQVKSITKGGNLIKEKIPGIILKAYCSPNHLSNEDTSEAVKENGFEYFMTRNSANLPIYRKNTLVILPEAKIGERKKSPVISTYYDHLVGGKWGDFKKVLESSEIKWNVSEKPLIKTIVNSKLITLTKKMRDWKNQLK